LVAKKEIQMRGIPKFALSGFGDSFMDVNAPTYLLEESTVLTLKLRLPLISPAIYKQNELKNDQICRKLELPECRSRPDFLSQQEEKCPELY
jgi:hypothetical protein